MKILVCIKQVPDTTEIKWTENNTMQREGVESIINPYDVYAIEMALRIKKNIPDTEMTSILCTKNTGVVYLSTIPPGMRWTQVIQKLKEFGEINHSHLQEAAGSSRRQKNQVKFVEGWVEFVNKKDAKTCASQLNGRIVGGKKSGKYRDYMWNMKYLHGFKWPQLLEMMNYEKHLRNDKLKSEFTKQKKQDERYLANVSKSNRMKRKREVGKANEAGEAPDTKKLKEEQ